MNLRNSSGASSGWRWSSSWPVIPEIFTEISRHLPAASQQWIVALLSSLPGWNLRFFLSLKWKKCLLATRVSYHKQTVQAFANVMESGVISDYWLHLGKTKLKDHQIWYPWRTGPFDGFIFKTWWTSWCYCYYCLPSNGQKTGTIPDIQRYRKLVITSMFHFQPLWGQWFHLTTFKQISKLSLQPRDGNPWSGTREWWFCAKHQWWHESQSPAFVPKCPRHNNRTVTFEAFAWASVTVFFQVRGDFSASIKHHPWRSPSWGSIHHSDHSELRLVYKSKTAACAVTVKRTR